jgi:hypothetical protein
LRNNAYRAYIVQMPKTPPMHDMTQAEHNAVAFEMSVEAPGWYSGFLVACSVERHQGTSRRVGAKLGIREFAKASHQRDKIVAAWQSLSRTASSASSQQKTMPSGMGMWNDCNFSDG